MSSHSWQEVFFEDNKRGQFPLPTYTEMKTYGYKRKRECVSEIRGPRRFRSIKDSNAYYTTRKRLYFLHFAIIVAILTLIWSEARLDLTIYIGFISAGLAIALREIFTNIAALIIIVLQKPFEVGDRIYVNNCAGDVIDQKMFHFVVMEVGNQEKEGKELTTGKVVHIPNNYIFLHSISNANKGFEYIWNELEVRLTMDSNWQEAKVKFEDILKKHTDTISHKAETKLREASKKYLTQHEELTSNVFIAVHEGHIYLTLRFLSDPRKSRVTKDLIWKELLQYAQDDNNVQLS